VWFTDAHDERAVQRFGDLTAAGRGPSKPHHRTTDEFSWEPTFHLVERRGLRAKEADVSEILKGKTAIIYGGGGGIGGGVARTFAREGAKVFLVGRTWEKLDAVAFLASDRAAGVTGTMANVTSGLVLK
jgi:hypothetical protein